VPSKGTSSRPDRPQPAVSESHIEEEYDIPYADKLAFAQKLRQLTQEEVAKLVHIIQENAPQAFKSIDRDRHQIVVDSIDTTTF
jgi:hypothetical protein